MRTAIIPGSPILGGPEISIWRGTNRPRPIWPFAMDLAGSTMVLRVRWDGGGFETSSDPADPGVADYGGLTLLRLTDIDPDAEWPFPPMRRDVVRWDFSFAAAEAIPPGPVARYALYREVRRPGGEIRLYRDGTFFGRGA